MRLDFVIASEAKQSSGRARPLDCRVASLLAMTDHFFPSTPIAPVTIASIPVAITVSASGAQKGL